MRKKAIQLSVNFLVITIISIVVFGFGIYMVNKFFGSAEGTVLVWEQRTEEEIEALLDTGDRVAIPFDNKRIGNKKSDTFGVGILNVLDISPATFRVGVEFSKAYQGSDLLCEAPNTDGCGNPNTWLSSATDPVGPLEITKEIKKYEQAKFLVGVQVKDAPKATYLFDLEVDYEGTEGWVYYDKLHKLIVEVK